MYSVPIFPTGAPELVKGAEIGSSKQRVAPEDVLICKINPRINRVWSVGNLGNLRQIASSEWIVFRQPLTRPAFLVRYFQSEQFRSRLCADVTGVGGSLTRAQPKKVSTFSVPVPPLAEQQAIADKLDTLLAQVETTKARLERIPDILKRFRQSVLAAAVSGRLTEKWRRQNPVDPVQVVSIKESHRERMGNGGKKYVDPARFREEDACYQLPDYWEWFRAEELCDLITKGTTPKSSEMTARGSIPFVKVYNLTFTGQLDFTVDPTFISRAVHATDLKRSKVYPGDVLMNIVGPPLGKVSIVPDDFPEWNINQAICIFRAVCGVTAEYLSLCLRDAELLEQTKRKAKATAGQFNLTLEICRDFSVPVPPAEEQTEIVRRVDQLFAHAERIEQQVQAALERVNKLTQSILAKAFRGELTEQWRRDHPELITGENSAAALLDSIRAERAASPKKGRRTAHG